MRHSSHKFGFKLDGCQLQMKWLHGLIDLEMHMEGSMYETIVALCHRESQALGCSNYHVPSGRDAKRLSIDLCAPGGSPKPEEVRRRGE